MAYTGDTTAPGRIRLKVVEIAKRRGLVIKQNGPSRGKVNMTRLANLVSSPPSTIFPILRYPENQSGISFNLLARLCAALNCQPGDLLEYVPDLAALEYHVPEVTWGPRPGEDDALSDDGTRGPHGNVSTQ